jgi:hypothetical protein
MASKGRHSQTPYKALKENRSRYIDPEHLPADINLADPRNMKREEIISFFEHILQRQQILDPPDVFRFKTVKITRKGTQTLEDMDADKYTDDEGGQDVVIGADVMPPRPRPRPKPKRRALNHPTADQDWLGADRTPGADVLPPPSDIGADVMPTPADIGADVMPPPPPPPRPRKKPKRKAPNDPTADQGADVLPPPSDMGADVMLPTPPPRPKRKRKARNNINHPTDITNQTADNVVDIGADVMPPPPHPRPKPKRRALNHPTADQDWLGADRTPATRNIITDDLIDPVLRHHTNQPGPSSTPIPATSRRSNRLGSKLRFP